MGSKRRAALVARSQPAAAPTRTRPRTSFWRIAIVVSAGILAYANSLSGPFIFDDDATVVENTQIRDWHPSTSLFPGREAPTAGRPLVNASFAINYAVGGLQVRGYHVTNIAIHLLCGLALFGVVGRTLSLADIPTQLRDRAVDLAFAVALVWIVHPLNTEAVDYITQRTESMMGLFYLLTLYWAIRAATQARSRRVPELLSVVCCAIGMACKESMVTAPLMVPLYDRVFVFDSWKRAFRQRWPLYAGLAATWIVLGALLWSGPRVYSAGFQAGISSWTYLLNETVMITRYLQLASWPRSLVLAYGEPRLLSVVDVLPYALIVGALLTATVLTFARSPKFAFPAAWFFITLAPSSSFVPVATEVGAERRMYLPLAGLIALLVVAIGSRVRRPVAGLVLAVVCAACIAGTAFRNREYRSALSIAEATFARWPTPFSETMVGTELAVAGRHDEAIEHLRRAAPEFSRAKYHLGGELFTAGKIDEAVEQLQAFITEKPMLLEVIRARMMIGRAYVAEHKWRDAIEQFRLVLSMTTPAAEAHVTATGLLADALFGQEEYADAVRYYRAFLRSRPNDVSGLTNLAIALSSLGKGDEALDVFRRAVDLQPTDVPARLNLARALFNLDRIDAAAAETAELLRLNPDDSAGHDLMGRALASRGRYTEARAEFERAIELDPHDEQPRQDLDLLMRTVRTR